MADFETTNFDAIKISLASLIVLIVFTIIRRIRESLAIKRRLEQSEVPAAETELPADPEDAEES